jgi:CDP-diacylglycerol--glycerol-3-phosphate 3-phosphatidyltransferase
MVGINGRAVANFLFSPIAKLFIKLKISPDVITVTGCLLNVLASLIIVPNISLLIGMILVAIFVFSDSIDGTMSRILGTANRWGAFLDATCDRITDQAILLGLAWYMYNINNTAGIVAVIINIPVWFLVSYTRAKAESLALKGEAGIAERSTRIIIVCVFSILAGAHFLSIYFLIVSLYFLFVLCIITILQRMLLAYKQNKNDIHRSFVEQVNKPVTSIKRT